MIGSLVGALTLAAIGFGTYLMVPSWEIVKNARQSTQWPQTIAQVTSARVEVAEGPVGQGNSFWVPEVGYRYEVGGTSYQGNTIRFAHLAFRWRGSRERTREIIEPYANFPSVAVYYNPEQPDVSVLEPGVTLATFEPITDSIGYIAIGLVLLGFLMWLFWPRKADRTGGYAAWVSGSLIRWSNHDSCSGPARLGASRGCSGAILLYEKCQRFRIQNLHFAPF